VLSVCSGVRDAEISALRRISCTFFSDTPCRFWDRASD
jgi:hypothetical protein